MRQFLRPKISILITITFLLIVTLSVIIINKTQSAKNQSNQSISSNASKNFNFSSISNSSSVASSQINSSSPSIIKSKYNSLLNGKDFSEIYNNIKYEHVGSVTDSINIYNNPLVDTYITKKAEARGYIRRAQADTTRLIAVENSQILQPEAAAAFINLKNRALKDNIQLTLVSGYRSVELQKTIFVNRFGNYQQEAILNGSVDSQLEEIFNTTSIPGYSRHHTGYTFDLGCNSEQLTIFKNTACYQWISNNNFEIAKEFGLIPSYPEGGELQGPEPEAWEYVWVGSQVLPK